MKIHLTRDSVCAGDDVDAPHARTVVFSDGVPLETVIQEIARSGYLAAIAGGNATWSAVAGHPIAVVAQQWSRPKLLPDSEAQPLMLQGPDGVARLHFRYHVQDDPHGVYSALAGPRGDDGAA